MNTSSLRRGRPTECQTAMSPALLTCSASLLLGGDNIARNRACRCGGATGNRVDPLSGGKALNIAHVRPLVMVVVNEKAVIRSAALALQLRRESAFDARNLQRVVRQHLRLAFDHLGTLQVRTDPALQAKGRHQRLFSSAASSKQTDPWPCKAVLRARRFFR